MSSFSHRHVKGFSFKLIALKVDVSQDRKIHCLPGRACLFQPGRFTCWDSEGVNLSCLSWSGITLCVTALQSDYSRLRHHDWKWRMCPSQGTNGQRVYQILTDAIFTAPWGSITMAASESSRSKRTFPRWRTAAMTVNKSCCSWKNKQLIRDSCKLLQSISTFL